MGKTAAVWIVHPQPERKALDSSLEGAQQQRETFGRNVHFNLAAESFA